MTKLTDAIEREDVTEVRRLIAEGVDVNEPYYSPPGKMLVVAPPFLLAAKKGNIVIAKMLKEASANVFVTAYPGQNDALTLAMEYPVFIRFLVKECGFDPNRKNSKENSFLSECTAFICPKIARTIRILVNEFGVRPTPDDIKWVKSEMEAHDPGCERIRLRLEQAGAFDAPERKKIMTAIVDIYEGCKSILRTFELAAQRDARSAEDKHLAVRLKGTPRTPKRTLRN